MTFTKILLAAACLITAACTTTAPLPANAVVAPSGNAYLPHAPCVTPNMAPISDIPPTHRTWLQECRLGHSASKYPAVSWRGAGKAPVALAH